MKFSVTFFSVFVFGLLRFAAADSSNFTLECYAPGTALFNGHIYIGDDKKIYIANVTETAKGIVLSNGSLEMDDEKVMGIGKNYLSLEADSSSFAIAYPFTIERGILKLYGEDFHAVPSGKDGIYVLGSINAAAGRDDVIPIQIKAIGDDGAAVSDYKGDSVESTSSYSLLGSQTFDSSAASSASAATASEVSSSKSSSKNAAVAIFSYSHSYFFSLLIAIIV
ncbi:hypothetical protein KDRO_E00320 [Kluyveromyces lactis]|nr:hypothetical protein KDRO_E00320 [Kluyveromyces lactis]